MIVRYLAVKSVTILLLSTLDGVEFVMDLYCVARRFMTGDLSKFRYNLVAIQKCFDSMCYVLICYKIK